MLKNPFQFQWFRTRSGPETPTSDIKGRISFNPKTPVNLRGSYCDLFVGKHSKFGEVAMKRPRLDPQASNSKEMQQFEVEADTWRSLKHEYILEFFGTYRENGYLYMISPWIPNGALSEYIKKDPRVNRARLLRETAEALAYLHNRGMIHGDIKASNILVSPDIHALLCDFGLSRMINVATATGLKGAGTTRWQAPELWKDSPKGFTTDIYAFGITIYEVLSGRVPYDHLHDSGIFLAVMERGERPPKDPRSSLTGESYDELWVTAEWCWQTQPEKRPSISGVIARLADTQLVVTQPTSVTTAQGSRHVIQPPAIQPPVSLPPTLHVPQSSRPAPPPPSRPVVPQNPASEAHYPYREIASPTQPPDVQSGRGRPSKRWTAPATPETGYLPSPSAPRPGGDQPRGLNVIQEGYSGKVSPRNDMAYPPSTPYPLTGSTPARSQTDPNYGRDPRSPGHEYQSPYPPAIAPSSPLPRQDEGPYSAHNLGEHPNQAGGLRPSFAPTSPPVPAVRQLPVIPGTALPRQPAVASIKSAESEQVGKQPYPPLDPRIYKHPDVIAYMKSNPNIPQIPQFHQYLLLRTIRNGSHGRVKHAVQADTHRVVAIKLVKNNPYGVNSIKGRIQLLLGLRHPNIIQLIDVKETPKYIGLVTQYASEGELFDYVLKRNQLREQVAQRIFAQIVSAVSYLHAKGIIHLNIGLETIFLNHDRHVLLAGFGYARTFSQDNDYTNTTGNDTIYNAPETCISDKHYSGRAADVWSCGVVLYVMLVGKLPFGAGVSDNDAPWASKSVLTSRLSLPDNISVIAADLLLRMLTFSPEKRCDLRAVRTDPWLGPESYLLGKSIMELEKEVPIPPNAELQQWSSRNLQHHVNLGSNEDLGGRGVPGPSSLSRRNTYDRSQGDSQRFGNTEPPSQPTVRYDTSRPPPNQSTGRAGRPPPIVIPEINEPQDDWTVLDDSTQNHHDGGPSNASSRLNTGPPSATSFRTTKSSIRERVVSMFTGGQAVKRIPPKSTLAPPTVTEDTVSRRVSISSTRSKHVKKSSITVIGSRPMDPDQDVSEEGHPQPPKVIYFYDLTKPYYEFTLFSQHPISHEGKVYPTAGHFYHAAKFFQYSPTHAERIRNLGPGSNERQVIEEASRFAQGIRNDWPRVKVSVMDQTLELKFTQHPDLRAQLLRTGDAWLVFDTGGLDPFWGSGVGGNGRNELGVALMRLREAMRARRGTSQ
ncbi:hypothetical protein FRB99_003246 [Tulasnella sp. 403]|nr:hypothetical protein FRB99_003246 [Tulasnella sp. 403]